MSCQESLRPAHRSTYVAALITAIVLWTVPGLRAQEPADGQSLAGLAAAVAAERLRIGELSAELERRSAALAELSARLDALVASAGGAPAAAPAAPVSAPVPAATPPGPAASQAQPDRPRFEFTGDTLFRLSTLHQGYDGCVGCPDRTVGRMRLRFGVQGQMAPGVRAVVGVATGELNDPNTVYQTFGGNLARKVVSWDRAYLAFRPPRASWMELTAGKFPYPWVRSSMTFDVDFYPEGASERVSFDVARAGALRNVSFQAMQIVVNEQANGPDTMLVGGQATAALVLGRRVNTRVIATGLQIERPEHVLRAQVDGSTVGVRNTNLATINGAQSAYASGFRYANVILENAVQTRWASLPVTLALEYQRNLRAASRRDAAASMRLDLGRAQRRGDWQFGWHLFRVEQEAIMSALGESDWRAPSNVMQHRFAANLMLHDHVQALFTWYRGRTLHPEAPGALLAPGLSAGARDPWANRLYFDLLYRF